MAEMHYYEGHNTASAYGGAEVRPSGFAVIVNWFGALTSVALIVGLAVWAWQLTMRDVSGVPVIRALEGPMRSAPDDPGGAVAEHQGLAVNRISEGEEAAPAAERIVLAPAPLDLEEIDLANAQLPAGAVVEAPVSTTETTALIGQLLENAAPLSETSGGAAELPPTAPAQTADRATFQVIPASIPGVSRSVRPRLRPADLEIVVSSASTSAAALAPSEPQELAADSLPTGTRLVQLGAFDNAETARAEWARLARAYPDFFRGKARVIQEAVTGGRQFVRLRAHGFSGLSDARRFCTALSAQGAACIPVTVR